MTREEWLTRLIDKLRPMLKAAGGDVPQDIRVSCGWPSRGAFSSKSRTIGECWSPSASADKHTEIFVSPCIATGERAADVLAHELVHACGAMGHKGPFKRIAVALGLTGPMRATKAGPELAERLNALIAKIGPYPHAALDQKKSPHKKEGTRLLKVVCGSCGYTVRTTQKWIDCGFPVCPCGEEMEIA